MGKYHKLYKLYVFARFATISRVSFDISRKIADLR